MFILNHSISWKHKTVIIVGTLIYYIWFNTVLTQNFVESSNVFFDAISNAKFWCQYYIHCRHHFNIFSKEFFHPFLLFKKKFTRLSSNFNIFYWWKALKLCFMKIPNTVIIARKKRLENTSISNRWIKKNWLVHWYNDCLIIVQWYSVPDCSFYV